MRWQDIEQTEEYQRATPEGQAKVRKRYEQEFVQPKRTILGTAGDIGISALSGAIGLTEGLQGIADIPTGGRVGEFTEFLGYEPRKSREFLAEHYSPAQKFANKQFEDADGFTNKVKALLENPSSVAHTVIESAPSMLGGAAIGRGVLKYAPEGVLKYAPEMSRLIASAIGEGAISAGQTAETIRNENPDGRLSAKQSLMSTAAGLGTGAFNLIGGRLSKRLGFGDIDTMLVESGIRKTSQHVAKRIVGGGISEGVFEELPQSVQEQIWQNAALDKPLFDGVDEAAAMGLLSGVVMGSGANMLPQSVDHGPENNRPRTKPIANSSGPGVPFTGPEVIKRYGPITRIAEQAAQQQESVVPVTGNEQATEPLLEPMVATVPENTEPVSIDDGPDFDAPIDMKMDKKEYRQFIQDFEQEYGFAAANEVRKARRSKKAISINDAVELAGKNNEQEDARRKTEAEERKRFRLSPRQGFILKNLRSKNKPSKFSDIRVDEKHKKAISGLLENNLIRQNDNGTYEAVALGSAPFKQKEPNVLGGDDGFENTTGTIAGPRSVTQVTEGVSEVTGRQGKLPETSLGALSNDKEAETQETNKATQESTERGTTSLGAQFEPDISTETQLDEPKDGEASRVNLTSGADLSRQPVTGQIQPDGTNGKGNQTSGVGVIERNGEKAERLETSAGLAKGLAEAAQPLEKRATKGRESSVSEPQGQGTPNGGKEPWEVGQYEYESNIRGKHEESKNKRISELERLLKEGTEAELDKVWEGSVNNKRSNTKVLDDGRFAIAGKNWTVVKAYKNKHDAARELLKRQVASTKRRSYDFNKPVHDHKAAVQKALSEGKPVPKEVLADYPDLKPAEATPQANVPDKAQGRKAEEAPKAPKNPETKQKATPDEPKIAPSGVEIDHDKIKKGDTGKAETETGREIEYQWAIVGGTSLIASNHHENLEKNDQYPPELQPRKRENAAYRLQVAKIANNLKPARLGASQMVSDGAPVIGPDMVVESGNGRTIAIKQAYSNGNAEAYKNWILNNAGEFGVKGTEAQGLKNPVLVRIRRTEMTAKERVAFASEANESAVTAMSAVERANDDARKLDSLDDFFPSESGDIETARNRPFINRFISQIVAASEKNSMHTADGMSLSQEGKLRIRNAVFAKAYGADAKVLSRVVESTDNNIRNITNGMLIAAPKIAKMKMEIAKGRLYDLDISELFAKVVEDYAKIAADGKSVSNELAQLGLFGDNRTADHKTMLMFLEQNKRSGKKIALFLTEFVDNVYALGDPKQLNMFGAKVAPELKTILSSAEKTVNEAKHGKERQGSLFGGMGQDGTGQANVEDTQGLDTSGRKRNSKEDKKSASGNQAKVAADKGVTYEIQSQPGATANNEHGATTVSEPVQTTIFQAEGQPKVSKKEIESHQVKIGTFKFDIETVESPKDAAHVLSPLAKRSQETYLVLVLDENKKPISVLQHSIGGTTVNQVYAGPLLGSIHNTKNAHSVWFAHNHPTGKVDQSPSDTKLTVAIENAIKDTGIKQNGQLILGSTGTASVLDTEGNLVDSFNIDLPEAGKNKVKVTERRLKGDVLPLLSETPIATSAGMKAALREHSGGFSGVLLLDARHRPVKFVRISSSKMMSLRENGKSGEAANLYRIIDKKNIVSAAGIVVNQDTPDSMQGSGNLATFLKQAGVTPLDVIANRESKADVGEMSVWINQNGTFYSKSPTTTNQTKQTILSELYTALGKPLINRILRKGTLKVLEGQGEAQRVIAGISGGKFSLAKSIEAQIAELKPRVDEAYENDSENAGTLDEQLEILYEDLDNLLFEEQEGDGQSVQAMEGLDLEADMAVDLANRYRSLFVSEGFGSEAAIGGTRAEKIASLRALLEDYSFMHGGFKEETTDDQVYEAAKDAYESVMSRRATLRENKGEGSQIDVDFFYSKDGAIAGFTDGKTVHLVADGIAKGQAEAILDHERGIHLKKMLASDKVFKEILDSMESRKSEQSKTGAAIRAAMLRVPKDTKPEHYQEEVLSYLVEDAPKVGIVRRFIARVKMLLAEAFGRKWVDNLTAADLKGLAMSAVRSEGWGEKNGFNRGAKNSINKNMTFKEGEGDISTKQTQDMPNGGEIHESYQGANIPDGWKRALSSIKKFVENNDNYDYGIRAIDPNIDGRLDVKIPRAGDMLPNSYEWIDNEFTDTELEGAAVFTSEPLIGTNAIDFVEEMPELAGQALDYWTPDSDIRYVIVRGEYVGNGDMPEANAGLIANAQAVAVLDKEGRIIDLIVKPLSAPLAGADSKASALGQGMPLFSRSQFKPVTNKTTRSYNFREWFSKSKLKDPETNAPYVFYHGSNEHFTKFDLGKVGVSSGHTSSGLGFFFSPKKSTSTRYGQNVSQTFLRMENPYVMSLEESQSFKTVAESVKKREELQAKGHDGVVMDFKRLGIDNYVVVFEPNQIKSAEVNTGEFSRSDDDIRYSTAVATLPPPISPEDYAETRKTSKSMKVQAKRGVESFLQKIGEGADKYLGAISTRLRKISPLIEAKVRELDFNIGTKLSKDTKAVVGLLEKSKKMTRSDYADWDYARKNSDVEKINELIAKYNLREEYTEYRKTLDKVRAEANDVGLAVGFIEEYAPRVIKDAQGFLNELGRGDQWPIITQRLQARAEEMGISIASMTPEMKADIVSNMLFGGNYGHGRPGGTKKRTIKQIPPHLNKYYMASDAALMNYLHSMRKSIEARRFFGKVPERIANAKAGLHRTLNLIRAEQSKNNPDNDKIKSLEETASDYRAILEKYKYQRDYSENIGQYVIELMEQGNVTPEQEATLVNILNARFHESGTRGLVQAYKNLSYIDTMGSVISAITQIGDLAWSAYENGMVSTLRNAYKSATKKSRITKEDVGIERIAQEFADADTLSNAVAKVFKWVGLEKMDSIGKEAMLNGALEQYEKRAKKDPGALKREIRSIFEIEADSVIQDLQNKEISDNVKLLVYSKLLDYQPAALSEMPEQYLSAGNGRLFYMLKTYTLKQFDVYRREVFGKLKSENKSERLQAMRNMVALTSFLVLANAGADELKDFILGRETSLSDRATDNALRLFGVSKYVTWKARTEGAGTALVKQILPPFKFIDAATRDLVSAGDDKGLKATQSVPFVGKLAYWHMGRGAKSRLELWERRMAKEKKKLENLRERVVLDPSKRSKYKNKLIAYNKMRRFQTVLNRQKRRINRLKAAEARGHDVREKISLLENSRVELIQRFLAS